MKILWHMGNFGHFDLRPPRGPPGWIRTNDQRIRSPLLYPLSYRRVSVKTTRLTPDREIAPSHLVHGSERRGSPWRFTLATYNVAPAALEPAALIATSSAWIYDDRQEFSVASTLDTPLIEFTPTPTTLPFLTRTAPWRDALFPNPPEVDSWASCMLRRSHFLGLDISQLSLFPDLIVPDTEQLIHSGVVKKVIFDDIANGV